MKNFCSKPDFDLDDLPECVRKKIEEHRKKQDEWLEKKLGWVGKILVFIGKPRKTDPWVVY